MPQGFIPLSKQMDFLWNEVQGKEKSGFGKFLTADASSPEDYATLWDKYYERSGGAGDDKARSYANSVYAAMADGTSNPGVISPNAKFAYSYLTQKGLTPQQAAGITGRLMAESYEDMNPDARNTLAGGKGTYGIAQWRGSRLQDLADFTGVDIGDITSLPATNPGGGLLTSNQGGQDMAISNKPPYMMGGEQTYNAPNMRQPAPQQGGMRGLLSTLKDAATAVDPNTGLTGFQTFAAALDPLILPELRGGGESIRKSGAARVAAGNKNKTVAMLRARGRKDLAEMVERGMISPTDAASQLLAVPKDNRPSLVQSYEYFKSLGLSNEDAMAQVRSGTIINTGDIGEGNYIYGSKAGVPSGYRIDKRTGVASPIPGGPADIESSTSEAKKIARDKTDQRKDLTFFSTGERALQMLNEYTGTIPLTGTAASAFAFLPGVGQDQVDMQEKLSIMEAQMQVNALQDLRDTSPNGSSGLGQLTNSERNAIGKVESNFSNLQGKAEVERAIKSALLLKAYFEGGLFDPSLNNGQGGFRVANDFEIKSMTDGFNPFGDPNGPRLESEFSQFLPKYVAPQEDNSVKLTDQELMEKYR